MKDTPEASSASAAAAAPGEEPAVPVGLETEEEHDLAEEAAAEAAQPVLRTRSTIMTNGQDFAIRTSFQG